MKNKKTTDRYGNEINSLEESLYYISCRLDELTGNAMGNSYLKLDLEPTDLSSVEKSLDKIEVSLDSIADKLADISESMGSLSDLNETLENLTRWYISFNENKNK